MTSADNIYRKLQEHLHKETVGFPATETGSDIKLLELLFTPEQASATLCLTHKPEPIDVVHKRANGEEFTIEALESALYEAARRGLIFFQDVDGTRHYKVIPYVVGFYETQVFNLTPEFRAASAAYMEDGGGYTYINTSVPAMRTIPIEQSVEPEHNVASYDSIKTLVEQSEGAIAIFECICRKQHAAGGGTCQKTTRTETCMAFGAFAENIKEFKKSRMITKAEALELLRESEEEGLVFQPSNTQHAEYICSCCGCCCGQLGWQKSMPHPLEYWTTNYFAEVDPDTCTGCQICIDVCQVTAMKFNEDDMVSSVDLNRCIGCGNCVTACPDEAIALLKKAPEIAPPRDFDDLQEVLMADR